MRLSVTGISILRGNKAIWEAVRASIGVSRASMYRYIKDNESDLTKAAALQVLRRETGLGDSELLEEEKAPAAQS